MYAGSPEPSLLDNAICNEISFAGPYNLANFSLAYVYFNETVRCLFDKDFPKDAIF